MDCRPKDKTMFKCKICGYECSRHACFSCHVKLKHNLTSKDYFDTYIEPYDHKCPFCDKERKFARGWYQKTCGDKVCNFKQNKATCLEKYGCEYAIGAKQTREKICKTVKERYGVENIFSDKNVIERLKQNRTPEKIKQAVIKGKQTKLALHGDENYNNVEKYKSTCIEKYGVENFSQTNEWAKRIRKKIRVDGLSFDSKDELAVWEFCKSHGLKCECQPEPIKYVDELGKPHTYHPDFKIENRYVEVKGDHFFKDDEYITPFTKGASDEEIEKIKIRDRAKYHCMIENDVIIILSSQIKNLEKILYFE